MSHRRKAEETFLEKRVWFDAMLRHVRTDVTDEHAASSWEQFCTEKRENVVVKMIEAAGACPPGQDPIDAMVKTFGHEAWVWAHCQAMAIALAEATFDLPNHASGGKKKRETDAGLKNSASA
jgi:hypothetical protein